MKIQIQIYRILDQSNIYDQTAKYFACYFSSNTDWGLVPLSNPKTQLCSRGASVVMQLFTPLSTVLHVMYNMESLQLFQYFLHKYF